VWGLVEGGCRIRGRVSTSSSGVWYSLGWFCVSRVFILPAAEISDFFVFQGFLGLYFEDSSGFSQVQWEKGALLVCHWYLRLTEVIDWQTVKWPRYDSSR
jgi:hypothetical protein